MSESKLMVVIGARTEEFQRGMETVQQKLNATGDKFISAGKKMSLAITTPIVGAMTIAANQALHFEATGAKFGTVFGDMADYADDFILKVKELTPITHAAGRDVASGLQDLLVPMGFVRDEAAVMTGEFMHVAGALTNFNSATHSYEDVANAMASALTGQYMPLKSLGIQLDKTTIAEKALEMGLISSKDEMTNQIEAQVLLAEVYAQSGDALAAYTEENLDTKTKMGLLKVELLEVAKAFGDQLLPIIQDVVDWARQLTERFAGLTEGQQQTILMVAALLAALGPVAITIGIILKVLAFLAGAFAAVSAPVLIVIALIAALIAAFVYLWNTNEAFRDGVIAIWEGIKAAALAIWGALQDFWAEHGAMIMEALGAVWDFIKTAWETVWGVISAVAMAVFGALQAFWAEWGTTIIAVFSAAWEQIKNIFTTVVTIITNIFKLFTAVLKGDWEGAWTAIKNIGQAAWDFIKNSVDNLKTALGAIWDGILSYVKQIWDNIKTAVTQKVTEVRQTIETKLNEAWEYIKGIPAQAIGWGRDIIDGLIQGITNAASKIWGVVKSIIQQYITDPIKDFFGISSPSKLMQGFGENIAQGLAKGMESAQGMVADASISMSGMAGMGISGGDTKNVSINMAGLFSGANVSIGSEQDAKALARELYKLTASSARVQGVMI